MRIWWERSYFVGMFFGWRSSAMRRNRRCRSPAIQSPEYLGRCRRSKAVQSQENLASCRAPRAARTAAVSPAHRMIALARWANDRTPANRRTLRIGAKCWTAGRTLCRWARTCWPNWPEGRWATVAFRCALFWARFVWMGSLVWRALCLDWLVFRRRFCSAAWRELFASVYSMSIWPRRCSACSLRRQTLFSWWRLLSAAAPTVADWSWPEEQHFLSKNIIEKIIRGKLTTATHTHTPFVAVFFVPTNGVNFNQYISYLGSRCRRTNGSGAKRGRDTQTWSIMVFDFIFRIKCYNKRYG